MSDRKSRPWRLGLDLGTNSLGWCAFDLKKGDDGRQHPASIRRMGVRIFTDGRDPQSGASLAQERRGPRGARRRRDRYLDRRADLLKALIRHGLMPADAAERKKLEGLDPWRLRGEGLDRKLSLPELGRSIFHLNQRRGFKSNRKAERGGEKKNEAEELGMKAAAIDTAYLSRLTRQYLWQICDPDKTWVIPGQMTALLRRKWGLNSLLDDHNRKNRADHRHHAIDAYVAGLTDRSMLQAIQKAHGTSRERIIDDMPDPWDGYPHSEDA